ncbi:MAG: hypothetical protein V7L29_08685 [Nostoc sp.]|uniref:hypothetical protein n=1 Tax=Nostoc sp. TaxID=1180 RepID=UPI002FF68A81
MAQSLKSSGDKHESKVIAGSDLCRKALWQWVFTIIEPKQSRFSDRIAYQLGELLDTEKAASHPAKLVKMKVAARAARLLFRELVKS